MKEKSSKTAIIATSPVISVTSPSENNKTESQSVYSSLTDLGQTPKVAKPTDESNITRQITEETLTSPNTVAVANTTDNKELEVDEHGWRLVLDFFFYSRGRLYDF